MRSIGERASVVSASGVLLLALACVPRPAESLLPDPENPWAADQSKCAVRHSQSNPLIVEWPAADRGSLEMRLRHGAVVVRYEGCRMEVLRRCSVPGAGYRYGGFTRKSEEVRMRDADELYANLPVGAAKLEAKLETADALTVAMTMVGMYEADRDSVRLDELEGHCEGATHIVAGVQVGAYAFYAEREAAVGGSVGIGAPIGGSVASPKIGGHSRAERETLTQDGDADRCASATADDIAPPDGCGALIRLEVVPLGEARTAEAGCPEGTAWNGTQCRSVRTAGPPIVARGSGTGGGPAMFASPGCPSGTAYVPGGTIDDRSVGDFCLDLTEVTAEAYARCEGDGACPPAADTVWWAGIDDEERDAASELCTAGRREREQHPINCVTWAQAQGYCRWRGARLPSEVEWQWAAMGGADRRTFPWGDAPLSATRANTCGPECRAWFQRRGLERRRIAVQDDDGWPATAPVGSYPAGASRWGPLDLAGNVSEWTADWAEGQRTRRVRGGSFWEQRPAWVRNDDTIAAAPARRDAVIGFRCADDV
jgi:formylglycine-generating enzyme required for sulfatase activity